MSPPFEVPATFRAYAARGEAMAAYLDRLPGLVHELVEDWGLGYDGAPVHGSCALVVPVRTGGGAPAVLKVGFPHDEAEHEHLALQHWRGRGAVRLLRADPRRAAMLLERLHAQDLGELWDLEACEVVAGLYGRLHVPAPPQLRTLPSYVGPWTARLSALPRGAPVPRRLVEQATALGRDLTRDPASQGTMIHADLHYENVLAADREPWLAIDPKPLSGDPHYEVAPMLWNRWPELAGDVRGGVRRRFLTLVDAAGLDEDRARDWVVVRMMHNAMWRLEDPNGTTRPVSARDWLTVCVTIAKAVQE
ncbi:MAG TPA: aminoglycoside phosphotransferase family protein [Nocardioidaceae bacterium]|nr:aminoglycoside phosphotransferase family protein [Nocardioidaceae bacterium]